MDAIENLLNETLDRKFKVNNEILLLAFDKDIKHLESLDERLIVQSERLRKVEKAAFATS